MSHWHSNEQISPWHNHAPDTANYSSATGVDHPALCEELRNKVQFSIPQAFIVQGCCSGVRAPRGQCTADINIGKLKTIVARAGTSEKDVYDPLNGSSEYVSHNPIDGPKRMFERQISYRAIPLQTRTWSRTPATSFRPYYIDTSGGQLANLCGNTRPI